MRERKGLGAPVPEAAEPASPVGRPTRTTAVGATVPDQVGGGLALVAGPQTWPLTGTRLLVGRAGGEVGADVEIADPSLSRRHAELVANGPAWVLRDLGSTNGTWVGDRQLVAGEPAELVSGMTLRFGAVTTSLWSR